MEFNFRTQTQKIIQGDKIPKDIYSIACTMVGIVPSHKFIQTPKINPLALEMDIQIVVHHLCKM